MNKFPPSNVPADMVDLPKEPSELAHVRYVRERQLLQILPFGKTKLWELVRDEKFPKPIRFTAGVTAWKENEVLAWLRKKETESTVGSGN
jgi:prophage regulatory protein